MSLGGHGFPCRRTEGDVYSYGGVPDYGSLASLGIHPASPVVGMSSVPSGYDLAGSDGGVFAFGAGTYFGSLPGSGITPARPVVGIATTPAGYGWRAPTAACTPSARRPTSDRSRAWASTRPARRRHRHQPLGRRILAGGGGRWRLRLRRPPSSVRSRACASSRTSPSSGSRRPRRVTATGWWPPTAVSSPSGTPTYMGSGPGLGGATSTGSGSSQRRTGAGTGVTHGGRLRLRLRRGDVRGRRQSPTLPSVGVGA